VAIVKMFRTSPGFLLGMERQPGGRQASLASALECVPLNKLHGYGGDYLCLEGTYGTLVAARREIARVLANQSGGRVVQRRNAARIVRCFCGTIPRRTLTSRGDGSLVARIEIDT